MPRDFILLIYTPWYAEWWDPFLEKFNNIFLFTKDCFPYILIESGLISLVSHHSQISCLTIFIDHSTYEMYNFQAKTLEWITVKVQLFVGYQFSWFSWVGKRRFPLICVLNTSKPWIQKSINKCLFSNPRKLVSTN